MKKLLATACAALLLLTGCSDASTSTNTKEELFTVGKTSVNTNDIYQAMLPASGTSTTVNIIQTKILEDIIPVTDEIKSEADKFIEETKKSIGDTFEDQLKQAGFKDVEEYKTKVAIPNAQNKELTKKYVNDKFDELATQYTPVKVEVLQFATEAEANDAHEKVKSGSSMATVGEELGTTTTYDGKETVYAKGGTLPQEALTSALNGEPGLRDVMATANAEGAMSYYVINTIATDANSFKEEALDVIAAIQEVSTDASSYYFREYHFSIFDKTVDDGVKSTLPALLEEQTKTKK